MDGGSPAKENPDGKGVFFVGGVHGAGKTTLCASLASELSIPYFSSSALIKSHGGIIPQETHEKKVQDIKGNQDILIAAVGSKLKEALYFLLDGHTTILDENGQWQPIPPSVFREIHIRALICLEVPPDEVAKRLQKRDGASPDIATITFHQKAELEQAQKITRELSIPFYLTDGDTKALLPEIERLNHK